MKNLYKSLAITALVAVIGFAFALATIACKDADDDEPEQPQFRSENIAIVVLGYDHDTKDYSIEFRYTATVQGTLTSVQWTGIPQKIANIINTAIPNPPTNVQEAQVQGVLSFAFQDNNVVIIAEKTTEYSIYKVVADNKTTLWVNIDGLNNLQSKIVAAATALQNGTASKE